MSAAQSLSKTLLPPVGSFKAKAKSHIARQGQGQAKHSKRSSVLCESSRWSIFGKSMADPSLKLEDRVEITRKEYEGYKKSFPEVRSPSLSLMVKRHTPNAMTQLK